MLFLVPPWRNGFFVSEIFFRLLLPGVLGFGSVHREPCPTTNFVFSFFRWREEGATSVFRVSANHLAYTFFLPVSGDPREVTEYKHLFLTVILWRLATVNSNTRIVVIFSIVSVGDHVTIYCISYTYTHTDILTYQLYIYTITSTHAHTHTHTHTYTHAHTDIYIRCIHIV